MSESENRTSPTDPADAGSSKSDVSQSSDIPDALVERLRCLAVSDDLCFADEELVNDAASLIERLQNELGSQAGELQDERAKLRAARAELGMVRGKCDRLRELLSRAVGDFAYFQTQCGPGLLQEALKGAETEFRALLQEQGNNIP